MRHQCRNQDKCWCLIYELRGVTFKHLSAQWTARSAASHIEQSAVYQPVTSHRADRPDFRPSLNAAAPAALHATRTSSSEFPLSRLGAALTPRNKGGTHGWEPHVVSPLVSGHSTLWSPVAFFMFLLRSAAASICLPSAGKTWEPDGEKSARPHTRAHTHTPEVSRRDPGDDVTAAQNKWPILVMNIINIDVKKLRTKVQMLK